MASVSPYQTMLNQRYGSVPAMGTGAPEDAMAKARRMLMERIAAADTGTDPRMAEIMGRREQRIADQESELARFEKPSIGQTLQRLGASLMSNQSPFLGVAVGNALTQNLAEQQARRTEAVRRRMSLGEQRDALDMERINAPKVARREAVDELNSVLGIAKNIGGIEGDQLEAQARRIVIENAPAEAAAKLALLRAQTFQARTAATENLAQAAKASRPDSGGGTSVSSRAQAAMDKQVYDTIDEYTKAMGEFNAIRSDPDALPADVEKAKQIVIALKGRSDAFRSAYRRQFGSDPALFVPDKDMFAPKGAVPAKSAAGVASGRVIRYDTQGKRI